MSIATAWKQWRCLTGHSGAHSKMNIRSHSVRLSVLTPKILATKTTAFSTTVVGIAMDCKPTVQYETTDHIHSGTIPKI